MPKASVLGGKSRASSRRASGLGITLHDKQLVVVKSTQHFHARFAPLARAVLYVDTPGAITQDFANIPYKVRSLNYWPRVGDPWADDPAP